MARITSVERYVRFSLVWGILSSCCILILIKSGVSNTLVFGLKDAPIYLGAFFIMRSWLSNSKSRFVLILIVYELFYLFLNFAIINSAYNAPLNNIRQILAPLIILLIYCQLRVNDEGKQILLKVLCYTVVIVFAFGLFEQLTSFWVTVNLKEFFRLKGIPTDEFGMSYMFYEPMFGYRERMTSTFLDPISLGHFFASAGIFLFYLKDKKKLHRLAYFCCLVGLFLAISKGAIIQFFIGVFLLNPRITFLFRFAIALLPFVVFYYIQDKAGILIHVSGFLSSIETLTIFGNGIGSVGNYAKMFSDDLSVYHELGISDTYVGSVLGQIGLVGMLGWLFIACLTIVYSAKSGAEAISAFRIFISIFAVSVLSENTMNITSFLLPAIIIGLSMQIKSSITGADKSDSFGGEILV